MPQSFHAKKEKTVCLKKQNKTKQKPKKYMKVNSNAVCLRVFDCIRTKRFKIIFN